MAPLYKSLASQDIQGVGLCNEQLYAFFLTLFHLPAIPTPRYIVHLIFTLVIIYCVSVLSLHVGSIVHPSKQQGTDIRVRVEGAGVCTISFLTSCRAPYSLPVVECWGKGNIVGCAEELKEKALLLVTSVTVVCMVSICVFATATPQEGLLNVNFI